MHDELVFEVPEDEIETMKQLVAERMENVHALKVPAEGGRGRGARTGGIWNKLSVVSGQLSVPGEGFLEWPIVRVTEMCKYFGRHC